MHLHATRGFRTSTASFLAVIPLRSAICGISGAATRSSLTQHLYPPPPLYCSRSCKCVTFTPSALKGHFGDIAAKDDSQVEWVRVSEPRARSKCHKVALFFFLNSPILQCRCFCFFMIRVAGNGCRHHWSVPRHALCSYRRWQQQRWFRFVRAPDDCTLGMQL